MQQVPTSTRVDRSGDLFRLWLEFDIVSRFPVRPGMAIGVNLVAVGRIELLSRGCGVSGYDEGDSLTLVRDALFEGWELPPIRRRVPSVEVPTLPDGVRAVIGVPVYRGVWFPARNQHPPA